MASASLSNSLKASAASVVMGQITGIQPQVIDNGDGTQTVKYTSADAADAADGLNAFLNTLRDRALGIGTQTKEPVTYDMANVVVPVVLRQAVPWLLASAVAGSILGYLYYDYKKTKKAHR
jgi:hypothetical protein